ncbi:hypothetical protein AFAEC_0588 [Aliarcobacter faecis]|uniref:hypothetical protein n=1 Tax=Aliarcobacter faecis TaxID=1564138 RepID=UPI00047CF1BA|nr:hypothetical protein [Aliarcobacter faecis]QKF72779.1 hypothetical protein AFAEC_0588 [Aliarcobacter faecis]
MKLFFTESDINDILVIIQEDSPSFNKEYSPYFEIKYKYLSKIFDVIQSENIITLKYIREKISLDDRSAFIFILEGFEKQVMDILKNNTSI